MSDDCAYGLSTVGAMLQHEELRLAAEQRDEPGKGYWLVVVVDGRYAADVSEEIA
jgi:hypothetical protein